MYAGFYIENKFIYGPKKSGKYWIDNKFIYGPQNSGKFWINGNYIYGPVSLEGSFVLSSGYLFFRVSHWAPLLAAGLGFDGSVCTARAASVCLGSRGPPFV